MIPVFNFRPLPGQYEESSEPVPSTSSAGAVDITSAMPSTSVLLPIFQCCSRSTISDIAPLQVTPVHPVPIINPMSSIPSTSRRIQHHSDDFLSDTASYLSCRNSPATGQIHETSSPEFRFRGTEQNDRQNVSRRTRRTRNISCPYELQYTESLASDPLLTRLIRNPTAEKLEYASYLSRLNTFTNWPTDMTQTSEELADAGFYYTGRNDITTCHHCGFSRGNWSPGEDPWQHHAISSPRCCYLLTVRGEEYINNVTGRDYYETSAEAPTQDTVGSDERPNSENEIDEVTLAEKVAILEEENQSLKDARSCKVCTQREATITCLPCGHLATCSYCAPTFTECIICRSKIMATARTFFT